MKVYLVGGAVRDQLLGLPVTERDWVVVGGSVAELETLQYQQVGKDFPVFLHPDTKEEYALARTERKRGLGHTGFTVDANPDVSLEQDLSRRDLTINAIAQDDAGQLIDPYHGLKDIQQRQLRHISSAFNEDPLRVLRVARFHARLAHLGFSIAQETLFLMRDISRSGELTTLSAERIWREFSLALNQKSPQVFIQTLQQCEALAALLPELDRCFDQYDNMRNVAGQIGRRTLDALSYSARQDLSGPVRWSLCLHGINNLSRVKNITAKTIAPEADDKVKAITRRLKVPNEYSELASLAVQYCDHVMQAKNSKPDLIINLFDRCDVWRRPERFEQLLYCCEALSATNHEQAHAVLGSITFLRTAYQRCHQINAEQFVKAGLQGKAIGESLRNARKICLAELKHQF
tara:strand:- start:620 stop:1834 length:1215 start_codon:yes stop_codon:yes gene_type:complete